MGKVNSQGQWLAGIKTLGCNSCHQLGNKVDANDFQISWANSKLLMERVGTPRAVRSGERDHDAQLKRHRAQPRVGIVRRLDRADRRTANCRRQNRRGRTGVERNVVVTLWDWATPKAYLHDEIASDKRNPTVNANGLIYGSPEDSTDFVPILDPRA